MLSLMLTLAAQVSGVVLLPERGGPQTGAEVRIGSAQAVTDADGGFSLEVMDASKPLVLRVGKRQWNLGVVTVNEAVPTELTITMPKGDGLPVMEVRALQAVREVVEVDAERAELVLTILDRNQKTPIQGARVMVRGSTAEATSDASLVLNK